MEGSPADRYALVILLAAGLWVLWDRRDSVRRLLSANPALTAFVLYCGMSLAWSDYPGVAFRRWVKFAGDFVMVLLVFTEHDRIAAVRRLLTRVGILVVPMSILFVKYYPEFGRSYTPEGVQTLTGVTTNKNELGINCLLFGLASVWMLASEWRVRGARAVQGCLLAMAVWLLWRCDSVTSLACFAIGAGVVMSASCPGVRRRGWAIQLIVVLSVAIGGGVLFLNGVPGLLEALGRDPTLTGRKDLWDLCLGLSGNPLVGTGFGSFWLGPRLETLWSVYFWHPIQAHNGYIELYLNLGWIGLLAFAFAMIGAGRRAVRTAAGDGPAAALWLAYFTVGLVYNCTEAAIVPMHPVWMCLVIAAIGASEVDCSRSVPQAA